MFGQRGITEILASRRFTFSVEVFPPRNGKPPEIILDKLDRLSALDIDFISVTKGAMGSMRGGTVPIGYMIPERYGKNALVHFRCRDMDRREVENALVDHMYFGTRNILAVLGDPLPGEPPSPLPEGTHNRYASELVRQIADMNRGRYLPLAGETGKYREGMRSNFCIGVACYPEADDPDKEIFVMRRKADAGAGFAITQMIFSAAAYADYVDRLREAGINIPIIPGIRPVAGRRHVRAAEEVFGATVPRELKAAIKGAGRERARKICLDFTRELVDDLRGQGAPGAHLFILNDVGMAEDILHSA